MHRTGDILTVKSSLTWDPLSWAQVAIRLITGRGADHTAILINEHGILTVIESGIGYGCREIAFEEWTFFGNKEVTFSMRTTEYDENILAYKLRLNVNNTKYDFLAILQQAAFQLLRRIFQRLKWFGRTENGKADEKFYCEELAAWAHDLPKWWQMVPGDIRDNEQFKTYSVERY